MATPIDWNELLAGGESAANEALFGAPEWLVRKLGGGQNLDEYIKKYQKAHDIGGTVGLIGSSLIPVGGLAKGIQLGAKGLKAVKAAKGAEAALDLAKLAEGAGDVGRAAELAGTAAKAGGLAEKAAPSILRLAEKGAAAGALEQGARGYFKGEDAGDIGKDVTQGVLFGGLGGAAGGALAKYAPMLARLGKKATEKATIGLTNARTRELLQTVQRMSGEGSGAMKQARTVDDIRQELSDLIKSKKLYKEGAVEKAASEQSAIWKQLDDVYEKAVGGQKGADVLAGSLKQADLDSLASKYDPEIIKEAMGKVMSPISSRTGMANIRSKLEDMAKYARSGKEPNQEIADAMFDVSKKIRANLDDAVMRTAEASGVKIPPNFKREYGLLMPIAKGEVRSEIAPTKFGLGSPTFEKAAAASLLGGGSSLLGGPDDDLKEKASRAALGAALGFGGSKLLTQALRKGVSSGDTLAGLAEKVAPKIAEEAGTVAGVGSRVAANTNRAVQEAAPETEGEAVAAQDGAELGQATQADYMSQVLAKLTDYAKANGVEPDSQDFKDFIQTVGAATIGADGNPFDARELAGMFYPDPDERSKFIRALDVSRGIAKNLPTALKSSGGVLGLGQDPNAVMQKSTAMDMLSELIGDAAEKSGGTKAKAKQLLATALNSRATQAQKRKMIEDIMESYGIDFSTLGRVGLSV
jgi:hypothetical protein